MSLRYDDFTRITLPLADARAVAASDGLMKPIRYLIQRGDSGDVDVLGLPGSPNAFAPEARWRNPSTQKWERVTYDLATDQTTPLTTGGGSTGASTLWQSTGPSYAAGQLVHNSAGAQFRVLQVLATHTTEPTLPLSAGLAAYYRFIGWDETRVAALEARPSSTATPQATNTALGTVRGGGTGNVSINADGSLSAPAPAGSYTLPAATPTTLGGIKVGVGFTAAADGTFQGGGNYRNLFAASTPYAVGDTITTTAGFLVRAKVAFTSGATYNAGDWTPVEFGYLPAESPNSNYVRSTDARGTLSTAQTIRGQLQVLDRRTDALQSVTRRYSNLHGTDGYADYQTALANAGDQEVTFLQRPDATALTTINTFGSIHGQGFTITNNGTLTFALTGFVVETTFTGTGTLGTSTTGAAPGGVSMLFQSVRSSLNFTVAASTTVTLDSYVATGAHTITYAGNLIINANCDLTGVTLTLATGGVLTDRRTTTGGTSPAQLETVRNSVTLSTSQAAAYTLVAGDVGNLVPSTSATAQTWTVPASVFTAGQIVEVLQNAAGQITLIGGTGMTLTGAPGLKTSGTAGSRVQILFMSATTAYVYGTV